MKSSYSECLINVAHYFQSISLALKPKRIVEIGVLEGFSLENLTKHITCDDVQIYDLFGNTESFLGNYADLEKTKQKKNESLSNNCQLKAKIDVLRNDKVMFDQIYENLKISLT